MKKHKYSLFIILIVTIVLIVSYYNQAYFSGHDSLFHYANIKDIADTINFFNPFPDNISKYIGSGFGYGINNFYPILPHLLCAYIYNFMRLFGNFHVADSMIVMHFIVILLSGISLYFLAFKLFKNKTASTLASVLYMSMPYFVGEIVIRDAFCEAFMFLVLPMILLSFFELIEGKYKKFLILFVSGYVIGINSHLLSMFFYTLLFSIFFVVYHKEIFTKEKVKYLIIGALLIIGISLPFLTRLLEHRFIGNYAVFNEGVVTTSSYAMEHAPKLYLYFLNEVVENKLVIFINLVVIILSILTFVFYKYTNKTKEKRKLNLYLVITLLITLFLGSNLFFWDKVPQLFTMIQFPWRLSVLICLIFSLLACEVFTINFNKYLKYILVFLIMIYSVVVGLSTIDHWGYDIKDMTLYYGWGYGNCLEYFPMNTRNNLDYFYNRGNRLEFLKSYAIVKYTKDELKDYEFKVTDIHSKVTIELPRLYYLGYTLKDEKSNFYRLTEDKYGFLKATINKKGTYKLVYEGTILDKISRIIRILALAVSVSIVLKRCKNEKIKCNSIMF